VTNPRVSIVHESVVEDGVLWRLGFVVKIDEQEYGQDNDKREYNEETLIPLLLPLASLVAAA
jgi:hypothetical protein